MQIQKIGCMPVCQPGLASCYTRRMRPLPALQKVGKAMDDLFLGSNGEQRSELPVRLQPLVCQSRMTNRTLTVSRSWNVVHRYGLPRRPGHEGMQSRSWTRWQSKLQHRMTSIQLITVEVSLLFLATTCLAVQYQNMTSIAFPTFCSAGSGRILLV